MRVRRYAAGLLMVLCLTAAQAAWGQVNVSVSSPFNGASVNSSFTVSASASGSAPISGWYIYADNIPVWKTPNATGNISAGLTLSPGSHVVRVRAWQHGGAWGDSVFSVNVGSTSPSRPSEPTSSGPVTVSVSSPTTGASVSSPFTLSASATGSAAITGWYIYADNAAVWNTGAASSIAPQISLPNGSHQLRVRAWQSGGAWGDYVLNVNVGSSSTSANPLPTPPSDAKVWTNLEDSTSNWSDCGSIACAGGANAGTNYWTAPFQNSPSLDGSSREFFNGGVAWSNVLWIKKLGAQSQASNFLWDFWVRFDAGAAKNLWTAEYDLWQSVNRQQFMVGTQCNFGLGVWDVWNSQTNSWIRTSIPCKRFAPDTWHRIQWYLQRVGSNQYRYKTLVVDGAAYELNQTFYSIPTWWDDALGIQWQMDLDSKGVPAHQWIDKVKLTAW